MSLTKQVRDPVHGFIRWGQNEHCLVDTATFQRLRRVKQLACAHYVYPGATHTRFEHSLGTFHVASRLSERLNLSEDEKTLVKTAALLHDVGHGPFSHVSEDLLDQYYDRGKVKVEAKETIHELITCDIIRHDSALAQHLDAGRREDIIRLLTKGHGDRVLKDIVSGPFDADKMDYLLRDSLYCGVRYGMYDLDQLIGSLKAEPRDHGREMVIEGDGVHAAEQFILAKYYIYTQVYLHKVRVATDAMIARALRAGIEDDNIPQLKELFAYDGTPEFCTRYLEWDDESLIREYTSDRFKGTTIHEMLGRLKCRELHKQVFHRLISKLPDPAHRNALMDMKSSDERLRTLEKAVVAALDKKPHEVIVTVYDVKNVRRAATSERSVLIDTDDGPTPLEDESLLFRSISEKLAAEKYLDCFVSAAYKDEHEKKELQKRVRCVIENELPKALREEKEGTA